MRRNVGLWLLSFLFTGAVVAQDAQVIEQIVKEAKENSQLESLAHEILDVNGPRLVGTPEMETAHNWAVEKFESWGIPAENEQWGEWRGWQRGITHIDMVHPRIQSLHGRQLAWSPSTRSRGVTAEVIALPDVTDSLAFQRWLPQAKGKFVMISQYQPVGRPDHNLEEFATEEGLAKLNEENEARTREWREMFQAIGYNGRSLPQALEEAGAAGIVASNWSRGFGANKVFAAYTKEIPTVDLSLEDYGMLYRLAESGNKPEIKVVAENEDLGMQPAWNTIATIEGTEKPDEYIILSAHYDSWDGSTGATDNATGTIVMMETARILKKLYPNPKRTIIVGLWGAEEQGLNGSRAFVEDHPEIVANVQALFNQDNGTGRVVNISGNGFLHAYDYLGRWLDKVPNEVTQHIETHFPGTPSRGGTDHASFAAAGAPAFNLSSLHWGYWNYTWHTNLDTYDKIVFDEVLNNVILTAVLAYMASEDPETTSREKVKLHTHPRTGEQLTWPEPQSPNRKGGVE